MTTSNLVGHIVLIIIIVVGAAVHRFLRRRALRDFRKEIHAHKKQHELALETADVAGSVALELRAEVATLNRHREEYIELGYRLEAQKDNWKRKYMDQTSAHISAQNILETVLVKERHVLIRACRSVSQMRVKAGLEPLKSADALAEATDPVAHPVGTALEFAKAMRAMFDEHREDIDARTELRKLAERQAAERPDDDRADEPVES